MLQVREDPLGVHDFHNNGNEIMIVWRYFWMKEIQLAFVFGKDFQ